MAVVGEDHHPLEAMAAAAAAGKQVKKRQEAAAKWAEEEAYLNTVRAHPFATFAPCLCTQPPHSCFGQLWEEGKPALVPFLPKAPLARCDCASVVESAILQPFGLDFGTPHGFDASCHAIALRLDSFTLGLAVVPHTIYLSRHPNRTAPLCLDDIGHFCSS